MSRLFSIKTRFSPSGPCSGPVAAPAVLRLVQVSASPPLERARRRAARAGQYDRTTFSTPAEQSGFRELAASLAQQVRTHNTTGKIQELRSQVQSGQYAIAPRETAARMLLLSGEGE